MNIIKDWIRVMMDNPEKGISHVELRDAQWEAECEENRQRMQALVVLKKEYLITRGICIMNNRAAYRNAASTDVKATMREYVDAEYADSPKLKEAYKFLYTVTAT